MEDRKLSNPLSTCVAIERVVGVGGVVLSNKLTSGGSLAE